MGVTGALIAIAVILVVAGIFWAILSPIVFGLINTATGFFTATQLTPRIGVDETVCDLHVVVNGRADQDLFVNFGTFGFFLDNTDITTTWFDCFKISEFPTFELIDLEARQDLTGFVLAIVEQKRDVNIELVDAGDATQRVDYLTQPQLRKSLTIPAQISISAYTFEIDFIVSNIPLRDYILRVTFEESQINGQERNVPFEVRISETVR